MTDPKLAAAVAARKTARKMKQAEYSRGNPNTKPMPQRDLSPEAQRRRAETSRLRIQTSHLIDRIQKHAMGKVQMTPTQLAAAQTLLRKTLPDLVGVKAEVDVSPVVFNFSIGTPQKE
jgi:aryl-alcohol dehydrogenase-like predicted oxidoreductase